MGSEYPAECRKCGHEFRVSSGGGFIFHLLHCDTCGKNMEILFEEIGEDHLRYLKGLEGPYSIATAEHDKAVRDNYPGDPITSEEYHKAVEKLAGKCKCGGHYRFDAGARCPKCKSDDFDEIDGEGVYYD